MLSCCLLVIWWLPEHLFIHVHEVFPVGHVSIPYLSLSSVFKVRLERVQQLWQWFLLGYQCQGLNFKCSVKCHVRWRVCYEKCRIYTNTVWQLCVSLKILATFSLTPVVFLAQWYSPPQGISLWCETLCPRLVDLCWRDDTRLDAALPGAPGRSY